MRTMLRFLISVTIWLGSIWNVVLGDTVIAGTDADTCIVNNLEGCSFGRAPRYLIMAPRRARPDQNYQILVTILRLEYGNQPLEVQASILKDGVEQITNAVRFERPSSRNMQLLIPSTAPPGNYRLRVKGRLEGKSSGYTFLEEKDIEFSEKQASVFVQMSRPLYRQGQLVHFRVLPVKPDLMPKYGTAVVYIEDPTGFPVRRWQAVQTNAGGVISQSFQLSDQPTYGTWKVRVDIFSHVYRHPFIVEEFWEPRFDVNVTTPAYVMNKADLVVTGVMMANHTSGRPCVGNASITAYFRMSEEMWNTTRGWEKPYRDSEMANSAVPVDIPAYVPVTDIKVKDYHLYFPYEYRFIDYYKGRYDFEWTAAELEEIAQRIGVTSIDNSEVVFFFNVTDWYSSVTRTGWSGTYILKKDIQLNWIGGPVRTFKPGSRMKIQLAVSNSDRTPVKDGSVINTQKIVDGKSLPSQSLSTTNGIVEVELNLALSATSFVVQANYVDQDPFDNQETSVAAMDMKGHKYYSPTDSYISVATSTLYPKVNQYIIFHVWTSQFVPRIYYQIIAKGNIVDWDELEMTSRQKTFSVALSRDMDPVARIVVYYIQLPKEIVTDSLSFFINGTSHNQVSLGANRGKDFSRDTVEFNAYADPDSFLVTSGVLLDFYQRGLDDGITENKLIDELLTFDEPANGSYKHLWRLGDTDFQYSFYHSSDYGIDTSTTLENAGLIVMTDIKGDRLPNIDTCDPLLGNYPCFDGQEGICYTADQRCNGIYDGCPNDGADEWGCEYENKLVMSNPMDRVSRVMRFYDNSSWAWHGIFVKPNGRVDFRVDVPKYPLSWMVNAISMSRDLGLGIMPRPLRYDSVRYMYIQVEHPTDIVMGEQIGLRVTVFNYWYEDDYIEVLVTFHAGPDTSFVVVNDFGITSSYAPSTHKGDHQTIVFLEPGESKDIYMPVIPDKDIDLSKGTVNFHVTASCFMDKDEYYGSMKVKSNGVLNYYHTPYMIDLINRPSVTIPYLEVHISQVFRKVYHRENLYVPGSGIARTTFFGDVVVPGFFEDYLNAENLLYRPYGGGEMVTFNFAYNLLTLRFMRQSNQLKENDDIWHRALAQMRLALQRIMSYSINVDGNLAFKMFRDDPQPSLWLTAFVGKTLSKAVGGIYEQELYIPKDIVNRIVGYICSRQDTGGAFLPLPNERVFDRKMASLKNSSVDVMRSHEIPLTAYVVIALNDMAPVAQNSMDCLQSAKLKAAQYLSNQASTITPDEVFFMAITTYALSLTPNSGTFESKLLKMQRNGTYFADSIVYPNPHDFQNNIFFNKPRQELMNDAYSVQTTSYAMMALLSSDLLTKDRRDQIMKWINTMRNSVGGFASTQDTIVAMEALFAFTDKDPNRNVFDLNVNLHGSSSETWEAQLYLNKSGYVKLKSAYLPRSEVWGYIISAAQGNGRGMLQLTTTVRVEYEQHMKKQMHVDNIDTNPLIQFFNLEVKEMQWTGRNQSIFQMTNCVSWAFTQKSLTSGLAVLEVDLPTGYIAMNDSLREYVQSGQVPNLRRAEFYNRKVVFYFDYLDQSKTCVDFRADRWYPVSNATQEYRIRVYDYYEPGMHETTMYRAKNLNKLNICYVCGSYQCPYCPYFNTSTWTHAGVGMIIICLFAFYFCRLFLHRDRSSFLGIGVS